MRSPSGLNKSPKKKKMKSLLSIAISTDQMKQQMKIIKSVYRHNVILDLKNKKDHRKPFYLNHSNNQVFYESYKLFLKSSKIYPYKKIHKKTLSCPY